jgi:aarF domain-containing kinase
MYPNFHLGKINSIVTKRFLSATGISVGMWCGVEYVEWKTNSYPCANINQPLPFATFSPKSHCSAEHILPRSYDAQAIQEYWLGRPKTVVCRLQEVVLELLPWCLGLWYTSKRRNSNTVDDSSYGEEEYRALMHEYAVRLRESLTKLGPAFVKLGQQLSIRPDLIPPVFIQELATLCDSVQPVQDVVALKLLQEELCCNSLSDIFEDNIQLVASASLGQVYKATIRNTSNEVAIKVQRPDSVRSVSLDLFILRYLAQSMDLFTTMCTNQSVPFHVNLVDTFAQGSYLELDYENEARNQLFFRQELEKRRFFNTHVCIPHVYLDYTTRRVLTTEWIDGIKLADAPKETIMRLIPVGVELFLTQLLDLGKFHSDPHPGNLYVTAGGKLCLLDFGLCADIDPPSRNAMTTAIVHLLSGDYESLITQDAKTLGFLPHHVDTTNLRPLLEKILSQGLVESGSNLQDRKRKFLDLSNELNEVFFNYPFTVPPYFALITRGLGLLEGIALSGDPKFDIFKASYPYARRLAVGTLLRSQ